MDGCLLLFEGMLDCDSGLTGITQRCNRRHEDPSYARLTFECISWIAIYI